MSEPATVPPTVQSNARTGAKRWASLINLVRNPLTAVSAAWMLLLILACIAAPVLGLPDPLAQDLTLSLKGPTAEHLLGTDALGRDILSRTLFGGQWALLGALEAVVIALVFGGTIGVVAGYLGGWVNGLATRFADLLFSLPALVILLALAAVFGTNTAVAMASLGILMSASYLRLAQTSALAVRNELYVDSAKVSGISNSRIIFGHVLPNVIGPIIVQSSIVFGVALMVQATLGFLGLGPPAPAPDWGAMIADASKYINKQPWLLVPTGTILAMTILAVNLIGDTMRDGDGRRNRFSLLLKQRNHSEGQPPAAMASVSEGSVLRVENLTIGFPNAAEGDTKVVDGISFEVARGEIVALVGESGSGKTMTALAILGIVPFPGRISAGQMIFNEEVDLVALPEKAYAKVRGNRIGMISQEPMMALDPCFTVKTQLTGPLRRHRGLSRRDSRAAALELLREVGLPNPPAVLNSYPHQLSGGMAQRVAIAIALAGNPELLIADEPTTALDVTVQAGILDLLRELQHKFGMSIIFVTHDLGVVADLASRALVMEKGRLVETSTVEELFDHPKHPYTRKLIEATPSLIDIHAIPNQD